jgi:transposase
MGRKGKLPNGSSFLPTVTSEQLLAMYRKEKNAKAQIRLLSCLHRKNGKTLEEISTILFMPIMTIRDGLFRVYQEGLDQLADKKQPGAPSKLTETQKKHLEQALEKTPYDHGIPSVLWTGKIVRYFIQRKFGVEYKMPQVRRILTSFGFTAQRPRPHHRKANLELQEEFKKTSNFKFKNILIMDSRSFLWTKVSSQ